MPDNEEQEQQSTNRNKNNTGVFIPLNIEEQSYEDISIYFQGKRIAIPALFSVGFGILSIIVLKPFMQVKGAGLLWAILVLLGIYLIIVQFLIRKFTIQENELLERYKSSYGPDAELTLADIYNISSFDEKHNIARMYNLTAGMLVKVSRSSIIGKGVYFKEQDEDNIKDFYNLILSHNLYIKRYNRYESVDCGEELDKFSKEINKIKNSNLRTFMQIQNGFIRKETRFRSQIEVDYYFIYSTTLKDYESLKYVPSYLQTLIDGGSYTHIDILNKERFIEFMSELTCINYPDISKINKKVSKKKAFEVNPFHPIGLVDADGNIIKDLKGEEENFNEGSTMFDKQKKKSLNNNNMFSKSKPKQPKQHKSSKASTDNKTTTKTNPSKHKSSSHNMFSGFGKHKQNTASKQDELNEGLLEEQERELDNILDFSTEDSTADSTKQTNTVGNSDKPTTTDNNTEIASNDSIDSSNQHINTDSINSIKQSSTIDSSTAQDDEDVIDFSEEDEIQDDEDVIDFGEEDETPDYTSVDSNNEETDTNSTLQHKENINKKDIDEDDGISFDD